jgi:uncharacterized protein YdeI (YjbR/CyaY-like superfamily)
MKDKRIDAYIGRSAGFAKPILNHIRTLVHKACPEVEETIKWGFPNFDYHGIMCSMASFKQHCAFGFWKSRLMNDFEKVLNPGGKTAMGHFGQLKSVTDLPADNILLQYIKEAARLNEEGIKAKRKARPAVKAKLIVPAFFKKALSKNKKALATFEGFSYSNKKDYVEWITEAKTEATREKRMATTIEWLAEGKIRNWKYAMKQLATKARPGNRTFRYSY